MKSIELLRSIRDQHKVSGEPLLEVYNMQKKISAIHLPPGFDDSNDIQSLRLSLTESERVELGIDTGVMPTAARGAVSEVLPLLVEPIYQIRVHAILCFNDDGTRTGGTISSNDVDAGYVRQVLDALNVIYRNVGFQFVYDPATDFETCDSSLLNLDFTMPPNLNLDLPESKPPLTDAQIKKLKVPHDNERQRVAREHRHKMVLLFCDGNMFKYNESPSKGDPRWEIVARDFAFSGSDLEYIALPTQKGSSAKPFADLVAHESGHYFHQVHTHAVNVMLPEDEIAQLRKNWDTMSETERDAVEREILERLIKKVATLIREYVASGHKRKDGANVFDGDGLSDTPPDPGTALFKYVNGRHNKD